MQHKIYTIRDVKAEVFLPPFFIPSRGAAIRFFTDLLKDKTSTVGKHPEDYSLYELGMYDDVLGTFETYLDKLHVGSSTDFLS